jgi:hypothetical protein
VLGNIGLYLKKCINRHYLLISQVTFDRELSRLVKANTKSGSIRTTIPKKIVDDLRLDVNDVLEWRIDTEKGEKFARVKRLK